MCGELHNGKVDGLVSVERWSCNRGVVEYTTGRLRKWSLQRRGLVTDVCRVAEKRSPWHRNHAD